jgi:hypothetical protein
MKTKGFGRLHVQFGGFFYIVEKNESPPPSPPLIIGIKLLPTDVKRHVSTLSRLGQQYYRRDKKTSPSTSMVFY